MYKVGRSNIKRLLAQKGLTQSELAERLGMSRQQLNRYVQNQRIPNAEITKNIAVELDCEMDDLFEWVIGRKE